MCLLDRNGGNINCPVNHTAEMTEKRREGEGRPATIKKRS